MNNLIHCDMCGYLMTKRWSETIDGKTYCRDCVPKKRLIDSGEPTEFDDTDEIVCPYCGHRYEDSYECGGNDEYFEEECEDCEREFYVTRIIDISYDTKPKEATEASAPRMGWATISTRDVWRVSRSRCIAWSRLTERTVPAASISICTIPDKRR